MLLGNMISWAAIHVALPLSRTFVLHRFTYALSVKLETLFPFWNVQVSGALLNLNVSKFKAAPQCPARMMRVNVQLRTPLCYLPAQRQVRCCFCNKVFGERPVLSNDGFKRDFQTCKSGLSVCSPHRAHYATTQDVCSSLWWDSRYWQTRCRRWSSTTMGAIFLLPLQGWRRSNLLACYHHPVHSVSLSNSRCAWPLSSAGWVRQLLCFLSACRGDSLLHAYCRVSIKAKMLAGLSTCRDPGFFYYVSCCICWCFYHFHLSWLFVLCFFQIVCCPYFLFFFFLASSPTCGSRKSIRLFFPWFCRESANPKKNQKKEISPWLVVTLWRAAGSPPRAYVAFLSRWRFKTVCRQTIGPAIVQHLSAVQPRVFAPSPPCCQSTMHPPNDDCYFCALRQVICE